MDRKGNLSNKIPVKFNSSSFYLTNRYIYILTNQKSRILLKIICVKTFKFLSRKIYNLEELNSNGKFLSKKQGPDGEIFPQFLNCHGHFLNNSVIGICCGIIKDNKMTVQLGYLYIHDSKPKLEVILL